MPTIGNEVSLYFHVPFCKVKCPYCHFYVIPDAKRHKSLYLEALKKEWIVRLPLLSSHNICSIYFGGGTPSLFPEAAEEILGWIKAAGLNVLPDAEITLEANPEDVSLQMMERLYSSGINRISMGVQSLSDSLLGTLGRTHNAAKAINALWEIESVGFRNVSIDLMYDLPGQTFDDWQKTLDRAVQLPITHLSLYNLTLEPHTIFFKKREELSKLLPTAEMSLKMLEAAVTTLEKAGLKRYEISAFAKVGKKARHNVGYWQARPFLGFGPSAFSYWEKKRFRNIPNLSRYAEYLNHEKEPVDFSECLSLEERQKELLAVEIRLLDGVDLDLFQEKNGTLSKGALKSLEELSKGGFLYFQNKSVLLTEKGKLFYDTVAEAIV